jgi:glycosyltransferase involved in cell wall biosynthesis
MTQLITPIDNSTASGGRPSAKRTLKVLHVVNGEHYAGAARVQDLLALRLPEFGYEVSFACVYPNKFEAQRQSVDSPLYNFPMRHRLDFRPVRNVVDLAKSEGYDLLHSHTTRSAMIAAAASKLAKVPYVHHVHCQMNTEVGRRVKTRICMGIERMACNYADRTIAVSGSIGRFMVANGFTRSPISVVPNGVPAAVTLTPRREHGQPWTIGMIALLRERKGLETLLQALPGLRKNHNVRLRIVGSFAPEKYGKEMLAMASGLGISEHVDWTGFTRNVNHEIAQMDVVVLPSVLPEGMPMVLLEAMSAGVPIAGSKVDGITDVIRHEDNGVLFAPADAESLTAQLLRIISGELSWNALRSECLNDYKQSFSDRAMATNMATVYNEVLGNRIQL